MDEDITIEDVVDCRIILIRQVGDFYSEDENVTANKMEDSSDAFLIDLTGDDEDDEKSFTGEDSTVQLVGNNVSIEPLEPGAAGESPQDGDGMQETGNESDVGNAQEAPFTVTAAALASTVEAGDKNPSRRNSSPLEDFPTIRKEDAGIEDMDGFDENDIIKSNTSTTVFGNDTAIKDNASNNVCQMPKGSGKCGDAIDNANGILSGDDNSSEILISKEEKMANNAVQSKCYEELEAVKHEAGQDQDSNNIDDHQEKKSTQIDCIEILDSSDSEEEDEGDVGNQGNDNDENTGAITIDDHDNDGVKSDEDKVVFVPPNASEEAKRERARKRQEARMVEETKLQLERKLLEARQRVAKKSMQVDDKTSDESYVGTVPKAPFATATMASISEEDIKNLLRSTSTSLEEFDDEMGNQENDNYVITIDGNDDEDCIDICDESDEDDIAFVPPNASEEAKRERARKRQEARRVEDAKLQLERKLLEARRRKAKELMATYEVKAISTTPSPSTLPNLTIPNFTFYTGPTKRERSQETQQTSKDKKETQQTSKDKKRPHPSYRYSYLSTSDAAQEQERLFREAAARVKGQEMAHRRIQIARGGVQFYSEPVKDVATLPKDHFKWSNLYSRLGLPQRAPFDDVKKNYRRLCLLYHPDKARGNEQEVQDRFQAIKDAYETISESHGM